MKLQDVKFNIYKDKYTTDIAEYIPVGWAIYDFNDESGDNATEAAYYLGGLEHKNRQFSVTISETALHEMLAQIRALKSPDQKKYRAYGWNSSEKMNPVAEVTLMDQIEASGCRKDCPCNG